MVHAHRAEEARAILAEAQAEHENEVPEPVNASHLEAGKNRRWRSYGTRGAYVRMYLFTFGLMALSFGVFLLARLVGLT